MMFNKGDVVYSQKSGFVYKILDWHMKFSPTAKPVSEYKCEDSAGEVFDYPVNDAQDQKWVKMGEWVD